MPELEEYVIDVVKYTGGFIVKKINKNNNVCNPFLTDNDTNNRSLLLKLKTRGKLINISSDVHKICLAAEYIRVIRFNSDKTRIIKNEKC